MSPLADFLPPPHTVLYLANVALAVGLACGTALLAVLAGRRWSAPTRHGLSLLALVLVLTSPALIWLAGRTGVGRLQVTLVENREPNAASRVVPEAPGPSVAVPQDHRYLDSEAARQHPGSASEHPSSPLDAGLELPVNASPGPERLVEKVTNPAGATPGTSWPRWWLLGQGLALVWAAGTVVSLAWLLCGLVRLAAFCRGRCAVGWDSVPTSLGQGCERAPSGSGRSPNLRGVLPAAARAAAQVGLARLPRLFTSAHTPTPVTFGLFWPAVVLPEGLADDLPPDQLDAVLVHELAHVVRRDPWVGLLQRLAAALYWWCPLVHQLNRQLADVREEVCDNYVLCSQDDGASLAEVLVALAARVVKPSPLPATVSMWEQRRARERSQALEQRIRRLLSTETSPMTRMNRVSLLLVVLAGVGMTVAISLSHVRAAGEDIPAAESGAADFLVPLPEIVLDAVPQLQGDEAASADADLIAEIKRLRGKVELDVQRPGKPLVGAWLQGRLVDDRLCERLKGAPHLETLHLWFTRITDAGLQDLGSLTGLRRLSIADTPITDAGLAHLQELDRLERLYLPRTEVTGAGLADLQGLKQLDWLDLRGTPITDGALEHLRDWTQLRELWLDETNLTGAGLAHLRGLSQLERVYLEGTEVRAEDVRDLKRALPRVRIHPVTLAWGWQTSGRGEQVEFTAAQKRIITILEEDTRIEFIETPLRDVAAFLRDQHDIPLRIDEESLRAASLGPELPVTQKLTRMSLHTGLRLLLRRFDLTYVVGDEALIITTLAGSRQWLRQGAIGADEVQRELAGNGVFEGGRRAIFNAFKKPIEIRFAAVPLAQAVADVEDKHNIPVALDLQGLGAVGVRPDVSCTMNEKDVTLESGLRRLLAKLGLTYVVDDEVLLITAPKKGEPAEDAKDEGQSQGGEPMIATLRSARS